LCITNHSFRAALAATMHVIDSYEVRIGAVQLFKVPASLLHRTTTSSLRQKRSSWYGHCCCRTCHGRSVHPAWCIFTPRTKSDRIREGWIPCPYLHFHDATAVVLIRAVCGDSSWQPIMQTVLRRILYGGALHSSQPARSEHAAYKNDRGAEVVGPRCLCSAQTISPDEP